MAQTARQKANVAKLNASRAAGTAGSLSAYNPNSPALSSGGSSTVKAPTIAPTLSNFGDVNKQGTKYTGPGYTTSTMGTGKDFTKVTKLAAPGQSFDRFGKSAEQMNLKTPGFIDQRNDAYITELARANPTFNQLDEATQKQQIKDLLIQRDTNKELYSGGNGEADVLNTINSIYNRIGQGRSQQEVQTDLATSLYDKDIQKIDAQYQSEKNNFLKQGAIEDRFTNFNEVNDIINKTLIAAGKHRQENLYTGTPTDQQIQEIANGLGQDFATTKKIMEGRGYEALQLQPDYQDQASQQFNRGLTDLEISRNRALEDATNQSLKTQTAITEQIDDTKLQMERNVNMGEKAGALSGATRSSGYMLGLDTIKNDALKNIDRLQTRAERDTQDTAQYKQRINETYELNAGRTKEDLDNALNTLKSQVGTEMSQYLNEYAPSSVELGAKLDSITDKYGILSQEAFTTYMSNLRDITDTMTYDTEKVMSLQKMKQDIQQTNVNNMLANNGMALAGINYTDLSTMLSNGDISPTDYSTMAGYMQSLGISQLQSMGVPTAEDINLYNTLLESNISPQEAIATIISKNPSRFANSDNKTDWKYDENSGKYMRTNNGVLEFTDDPTSPNNQGGASYTPVDQTTVTKAIESVAAQYPDGSKGGQCGAYANNAAEKMGLGRIFKDPFTQKDDYINSYTPKVGSFIMWQPEGSEYGHVGMVVGVSGDDILINDSNGVKGADGKYNETVATRSVSLKKVLAQKGGFFDPTKSPVQGANTSQGATEKDTYLQLISRGGMTNTDKMSVMKKASREGRLDEYNTALKQGMKTELTPVQLKQRDTISTDMDNNLEYKKAAEVRGQADTVLALMGADLTRDGFNDVSLINAFQRIVDPGATVREGDVALLQSSLNLVQQLQVKMDRVISKGEKLTPANRKSMLDAAVKIYNARAKYGNELINKKYKPRADAAGLDWETMGYELEELKTPNYTSAGVTQGGSNGTGNIQSTNTGRGL